ncbi:hypothetical protein DID75_00660 [Candidatus Marinamargulisbacteria bacterium SCGC AG-410-N11]|nr:hypothetical protein DID75_00660 [Candidatus Marinamargulisbacteria bacterium SCGC AG-410-N11]
MNNNIYIINLIFCIFEITEISHPKHSNIILKVTYYLWKLAQINNISINKQSILCSYSLLYVLTLLVPKNQCSDYIYDDISTNSFIIPILTDLFLPFEEIVTFINNNSDPSLQKCINSIPDIYHYCIQLENLPSSNKRSLNNTSLLHQLDIISNNNKSELSDIETTIYSKITWEKIKFSFNEIYSFSNFIIKFIGIQKPYLFIHSFGSAFVAFDIASLYGIDEAHCKKIFISALLHNIGKTIAPIKNNELDFSFYTFKILKHLEGFQDILLWASTSNSNKEKKYTQFSIESQIIHVADLFTELKEATTSRAGFPIEKVMTIITKESHVSLNNNLIVLLKNNLSKIESKRHDSQAYAKDIYQELQQQIFILEPI